MRVASARPRTRRAHVLRRLRAAPRRGGLAERRRLRRAPRQLSYKVVRPSEVTATLVEPGRGAGLHREPAPASGDAPVAFPPAPADPPREPHGSGRGPLAARRRRPPTISQQASTDEPALHGQQHPWLREALTPHARRPRPTASRRSGPVSSLTRPARVTATVETKSGVQVATISIRRAPAGRFLASWRGTTRGGRSLVYGGMYVVRFRATNEFGAVNLLSTPVPGHPGGAGAGQESQSRKGVPPAVPVASILSGDHRRPSRLSSATTASTRSFC